MRNPEVEITKPSYNLTAKIFHWSFVILFGYGISKQINNINQLEDLTLLKFEIAFALLFILFLVIRFVYMKRTQKSSLPPDTPMLQRVLAKVVHYGMYIGLISIAFSGLVIGCLYWLGLKSGVIIETLIGWHELSVSIVYWLVGLHLIGAIYHRLKNDGVWQSMVPTLKRGK
jgi:cytochrome b561